MTLPFAAFASDSASSWVHSQYARPDEFKTSIRTWLKKEGINRDHPLSKLIIRNYFFDTIMPTFDPQVNLDQPLSRSLEDFWIKATWKALTDPSFNKENYPELYSFLGEHFFRNGERFVDDEAARLSKLSEGKIRWLRSNTEAWYARHQLVQSAKQTLYVQYFILSDDIFGLSFLEQLRQKALEGVKVKLMLDARGAWSMYKPWRPSVLSALADAGVEIRLYNSWIFSGAFAHPFAANHDKIIVVDHQDFIVGGRNISKDYFPEPEDHHRVFEDGDVVGRSSTEAMRYILAFNEEFYSGNTTHLRDELTYASPQTVSWLKNSLPAMEEWMFTDHMDSEWISQYPELKQYPRLKGYDFGELFRGAHQVLMKAVDSNSVYGPRNDLVDLLYFMIQSAQKRILIHTPYAVLTPTQRKLLVEASQRGVRIQITTNSYGSSDIPFPVKILKGEWKKLMSDMPTLEIYMAKGPERLHQKLYVFDDEHTVVASSNLDSMSEVTDSEVGVYVRSAEFNSELSAWMESFTARKTVLLPRPLPGDDVDKPDFIYFILNWFFRLLM